MCESVCVRCVRLSYSRDLNSLIRYRFLLPMYYKNVHAAVVVYNICDPVFIPHTYKHSDLRAPHRHIHAWLYRLVLTGASDVRM